MSHHRRQAPTIRRAFKAHRGLLFGLRLLGLLGRLLLRGGRGGGSSGSGRGGSSATADDLLGALGNQGIEVLASELVDDLQQQ
jgi:hypothetical protein